MHMNPCSSKLIATTCCLALVAGPLALPPAAYAQDEPPQDAAQEEQAPLETGAVEETQPAAEAAEPADPDMESAIAQPGENQRVLATLSAELAAADTKQPYLNEPQLVERGVQLAWNAVAGVTRYRVYRKAPQQQEWGKAIAEVVGEAAEADAERPATVSYLDENVAPGTKYQYMATSIEDSDGADGNETAPSNTVALSIPELTAPKGVSGSRSVSWSAPTLHDGYQVRYASNVLFRNEGNVDLPASATSASVPGAFARVRAFKRYGTQTYWSAWALSSASKATRKLSPSVVKHTVKVKNKKGKKVKKKKVFELRAAAKQKSGKYDTVQGSCSDGTFGYYVLYNQSNGKCKIVKVKLSNMKVKKKSKALSLDHGNDLTYNPNTNQIVSSNAATHKKRLTVIDAATLKVSRRVDLSFSGDIANATEKNLQAITGVCNIAYDTSTRTYLARTINQGSFAEIDESFRVVRLVKPNVSLSQTTQGLAISGDYIMMAESAKKSGQYNRINVFDRNTGEFTTRINLKGSLEIESMYFIKNKLYATYYKSSSKLKKKNGKIVRAVNRTDYIYRVKGY